MTCGSGLCVSIASCILPLSGLGLSVPDDVACVRQAAGRPGGAGAAGGSAHSSAVVELRALPGGSGLRFSTAAWDGLVVLWDAAAAGAALPCGSETMIAAVR